MYEIHTLKMIFEKEQLFKKSSADDTTVFGGEK